MRLVGKKVFWSKNTYPKLDDKDVSGSSAEELWVLEVLRLRHCSS